MSQALAHFAVGFGGFLLVVLVCGYENEWWVMSGAVLSGFWALVPDFHHMLRIVHSGVESWYYVWVHETIVANLFWFHRFMDTVDPGNSNGALFVALVFLLICVGLFEWVRFQSEGY